MDKIEFQKYISSKISDIRQIIEEYVKTNAKYKIGDIVKSYITPNGYFAITQIGFEDEKIVYYGKKIRKSDGEITYMDMDANIGTYEKSIEKITLTLKDGTEITHIQDSSYFNSKIFIKINI